MSPEVSKVEFGIDGNGLEHPSAAQCQHVRAVSIGRVDRVRGNVGAVALRQIRDVIGLTSTYRLEPRPSVRATSPMRSSVVFSDVPMASAAYVGLGEQVAAGPLG
jgi:hypothetical protein